MKSFEERARALVKGMTPTAKMFLPSALIALLVDMCITLDNLKKEEKK